MKFLVLGPLSVVGEGGCVELRASKLNSLLAALLLRGGQSASTGYLSDAVWDVDAPEAAKAALHTAIMRLRRLFAGLGFAHDTIATTPHGYRLITEAAELDLIAFREARVAAEEIDDPRERRDALRLALAMWTTAPTQAEPLLNVPSELLRRDVVPVLVEEWKQTAEHCYELDLGLGDGREILRELREATAAFPSHEGFSRQLAMALWRTDRQHEALAEIRRIRELLRDELGLSPGEALKSLEMDILRGDAPANAPALRLVRKAEQSAEQSPPCGDLRRLRDRATGSVPLVGRGEELALLESVLAPAGGGGVAVICGPPGIGKSAFAANVVARVADRFAGGVAYHCADHPVTLDVPTQAGPRLIVVDNAGESAAENYRGYAQGGTWVLLVSRYCHRDLAGDHGVVGIRLRALAPPERMELATRLVADPGADPHALARFTELTFGFPSALVLAAARLRLSRDRDLGCFVTWLGEDPIRRLSASRDPRASIALAYREHIAALRPATRAAFLTFARQPSPEIDVVRAAEVFGIDELDAELALEELVDACLADVDAAGHYSLPELARAVAGCLTHHPESRTSDNRPLLTTADRRRA